MKKTVFNFRTIILLLFLCFLGYLCFLWHDIDALAIIIPFSIIISFAILISPIAVTFSDDFLTIHYFFGVKEEIKWTHIRKIEKLIAPDRRPNNLHFLCYHIYLRKKPNKKVFFAVSEIPANRRIKNLLYQYYRPDFDKKN